MSDTPRSPTYSMTRNYGPPNPYGWKGTAPYNPFQVPDAEDLGGEIALYERLDWSGPGGLAGTDISSDYRPYSNPPFIGVGSTGARVPEWMAGMNPNIPKRILRGYMRRQEVDLLRTATDPRAKATNARLFFMYNPSSIERAYMSADALTQSINPTGDPGGPDQASTPLISYTSVSFDLLFDRAEEVARYQNHPGVLVDLAVFDMLARGGSPGQSDAPPDAAEQAKYDATTAGGGAVSVTQQGGGGAQQDSTSLILNVSIPIVAIFSPNIAFYGNIVAATAMFEKFSHRMTPTRMRITVTMRINAVGPAKQATTRDASVEGAAQTTAALRALDPQQPAATDAKRDEINASGRASAMAWAENWLPNHATPAGVAYSMPHRCDNPQVDDYFRTDAEHIPSNFDCSSFVARAYGVIGWLDALHLPKCADTNGFEKAAREHTDAWETYDLKKGKGWLLGGNDLYNDINEYMKPGDLILRSGSGSDGHIGFIHDDVGGGDGGDHKWKILHSYHTGDPPQITDPYTTAYISEHYTKILRAKPQKTGEGPDVHALPTAQP